MRRDRLIARVQRIVERRGAPRLLMLSMVIASAGAGALASVAILRAGLHAMWLRYGLGVVIAYAAFMFILQTWMVWRRRFGWRARVERAGDALDLANPLPPGDSRGAVPAPSGGRGGGGGGGLGALDADDALVLIVVVIAALAVIAAAGYVVLGAPALFAELIVDGLFGAAIYRRLGHLERRHWETSVFRRTRVPVAVVAVFVMLAGLVGQLYAPEARTLAGVWQHHAAKRAP